MATGHDLLALKQEVQAAEQAVSDRRYRGSGWFLLSWLGALIATAAGFAMTLFGMKGITMGMPINDTLTIIGGVASFAVGYTLYRVPYIVHDKDKELARLKAVASTSAQAYSDALMAELATYGVDTGVRTDRTEFLDADYEFTALRNGDPVDITVRDFNNEIVFMLNGERMQKPVSV